MAEFTGITAARADEILGMSVVSGTINGAGHLILTRENGQEIDAGDFTGIVTSILGEQVQDKVDETLPSAVAGTVINKGNVGNGSIPTALTLPELNSNNIVNAMVKVTMIGNLTFDVAALPSSPKPNTQWVLRLQQDATGGRTFTATGFKKSMGVLPLTSTAGAIDLVVFIYDGTSWLCGLMGADFK